MTAAENLRATCARGGVVVEAEGSSPDFEELVSAYGNDARRDQSRALRLTLVSVLLLVAAGAAVAVMALRASEGLSALPYVAVVAPLVVAAGLLAWQADKYRRSAAEARRTQRQLMTLTDYLEPFPQPMRSVMRASLATRFFGRTLDDLDALREVRVPQTADLLRSLGVPEPGEAVPEPQRPATSVSASASPASASPASAPPAAASPPSALAPPPTSA